MSCLTLDSLTLEVICDPSTTEWLVHMTNLQGVSFLLFVDLIQPEIFGMVCGNKKKLNHSKKEKTPKHLSQA